MGGEADRRIDRNPAPRLPRIGFLEGAVRPAQGPRVSKPAQIQARAVWPGEGAAAPARRNWWCNGLWGKV